MSCSLIGKTPFFGNGLYPFDSGQLSKIILFLNKYFKLKIKYLFNKEAELDRLSISLLRKELLVRSQSLSL